MTPENLNASKEQVLEHINLGLLKHNESLAKEIPESKGSKETKKIISKYEYLKAFTEWSMGKTELNLFKYYSLSE